MNNGIDLKTQKQVNRIGGKNSVQRLYNLEDAGLIENGLFHLQNIEDARINPFFVSLLKTNTTDNISLEQMKIIKTGLDSNIATKIANSADGTYFEIKEGVKQFVTDLVIEGNIVTSTQTINGWFGSAMVTPKTGIVMNNEMDDFSVSHDVPNVFGLFGMKANYIAPGKRPLSSMSPTFVEDNKGVLIVGTPGGSRIISMVLLVIVDYVDNQQTNPMKLVSNSRFHHQYLPDYMMIEPDAFDEQWVSRMKSKGHAVQTGKRLWGNMQLIYINKNNRDSHVANDPRGFADTRY
mgnify:CR=1 FL=1